MVGIHDRASVAPTLMIPVEVMDELIGRTHGVRSARRAGRPPVGMERRARGAMTNGSDRLAVRELTGLPLLPATRGIGAERPCEVAIGYLIATGRNEGLVRRLLGHRRAAMRRRGHGRHRATGLTPGTRSISPRTFISRRAVAMCHPSSPRSARRSFVSRARAHSAIPFAWTGPPSSSARSADRQASNIQAGMVAGLVPVGVRQGTRSVMRRAYRWRGDRRSARRA